VLPLSQRQQQQQRRAWQCERRPWCRGGTALHWVGKASVRQSLRQPAVPPAIDPSPLRSKGGWPAGRRENGQAAAAAEW